MNGYNSFYSILKGQNKYKKTSGVNCTLNIFSNWIDINVSYEGATFINDIFQHFLGYTHPDPDAALQTVWFAGNYKSLYDLQPCTSGSLKFPDIIPTCVPNPNRKVWNAGIDAFEAVPDGEVFGIVNSCLFGMSINGYTKIYTKLDQVIKDIQYAEYDSLIRVYYIQSDSNPNLKAFLIKPIGEDRWNLPYCDLKYIAGAKLYAEISYGSTGSVNWREVPKYNSFNESPSQEKGSNVSRVVMKRELIEQIGMKPFKNIGSNNRVPSVRFRWVLPNGIMTQPSVPLQFQIKRNGAKLKILAKND
jgi:hypothetical protein